MEEYQELAFLWYVMIKMQTMDIITTKTSCLYCKYVYNKNNTIENSLTLTKTKAQIVSRMIISFN